MTCLIYLLEKTSPGAPKETLHRAPDLTQTLHSSL